MNEPKEHLIEVFPWISQILSLRSFFRTKKVILADEPICDYNQAQLVSKGCMGPWSFNTYETFLASCPTQLLIIFLTILSPSEPALPTDIGIDLNNEIYVNKFNELRPNVELFFMTFAIPLTLSIYSFFVGFAAIRWKDQNRSLRSKSRRAYAYYDGAYGLWPQALIVNSWILFYVLPDWATIFISIYIIVSGFYLFATVTAFVPDGIFKALGYGKYFNSDRPIKVKKDEPLTQYKIITIIASLLIGSMLFPVLDKLSLLTTTALVDISVYLYF